MKSYWKVALGYLVFGILWIVLSDRVSEAMAGDVRTLATYQTIKGWMFVFLSALLILHLTKKAFDAQSVAERQKLRIFQETVSGAHHIPA